MAEARAVEVGGRRVSYHAVDSTTGGDTAVLLFYQLGASSSLLSALGAAVPSAAKLLCIDRPGCRETSAVDVGGGTGTQGSAAAAAAAVAGSEEDGAVAGEQGGQGGLLSPADAKAMGRIDAVVRDALAVLREECIRHVFVLGVCLGHPFAAALASELCAAADTGTVDGPSSPPQLRGLTLIAPYPPTSCPDGLGIARFAERFVPSAITRAITSVAAGLSGCLLPLSMRSVGPAIMKSFVPPAQRLAQRWSDGDFALLSAKCAAMHKESAASAADEMQLAVSSVWARRCCHAFARAWRAGGSGGANAVGAVGAALRTPFPIRIHACRKDKLVTERAVQWLATEVYHGGGEDGSTEGSGGAEVVWAEDVSCHEVMTMFGGPPHAPVLFLTALRDWGLAAGDGDEGLSTVKSQ